MGITYPNIPAEDAVFREQFINNQYVADNGVVLTDAPVVNNGMTLNGTSQYATPADEYKYSFGDGATDSPFSIEFFGIMTDATSFIIASKGVNNVDAEWLFYVAGTDKAFVQCHDESVADCRIGRAYNTALTSYEGQMIHLVATYDGSSTEAGLKIYLNGSRVDDVSGGNSQGGYVAMEKQGHDVWFGRYSGSYADGQFRGVSIYDKELTEGEVLDKYTQLTFKEVKPESAEIWLPLRTHYDDGANEVTPNLGHVATDQCFWGTGAGVDEPTLLPNNGIELDGTNDHLEIQQSAQFNDVFEKDSPHSFSFLFRTTKTAVSVLFSKSDPAATYKGVAVNFSASGLIEYRAYENGTVTGLRAHTDTAWNDGMWHSATVAYDGSETEAGISFYVDREKQAQTNDGLSGFTGSIVNTSGMWIGEASYGGLNFGGGLKFPTVFPYEVTETQAKWLHDLMFRNFNL
jgi:hypothetical protein